MPLAPSKSGPSPFISQVRFKIAIWALSSVAVLFLATRFAIRIHTKGRLMVNDYFLVAALPIFFTASGLLHSTVGEIYKARNPGGIHPLVEPDVQARFVVAIELFWVAIYCVKFCFLAQFKFYKPPYAYVVIHLTRYYWASLAICAAAFIFTIAQAIVLCPGAGKCRYFLSTDTVAWEMAVSAIDIVTDMLVITIPLLLIYLAIFSKLRTIINATFKSLSIVTIAIAGTRMAFLYNSQEQRVDYIAMTFWLMVESATALIVASISSYRVVIIDHLAKRARERGITRPVPARYHPRWFPGFRHQKGIATSDPPENSLSELPILAR